MTTLSVREEKTVGYGVVPWGVLTKRDQRLLLVAKEVAERAHNPYSRFYVGSAVGLKGSRRIVRGANVENAAYGSSICAERSALVAANALGYFEAVEMIAIVTREEQGTTPLPSFPCGDCRQVMLEFSRNAGRGDTFRVIAATWDFSQVWVTTIGDLIPFGFGPENLGDRVPQGP